MSRPILIFQAPIQTRSGYGDWARDVATHLIELDMFDLKIVSMPWGNTPVNALNASNPKDAEIIKRVANGPLQLRAQPDVFMQMTIPNEFQTPAKVNIGLTAGIESSMCSAEWIEGCNKMTTVWATSEHSVRTIKETGVVKKDQAGNVIQQLQATIPFEVLHNCVYTDIFRKIDSKDIEPDVDELFSRVKEKFCFLFVGHWLKGGLGEDRKNVGLLVKIFCETFITSPEQIRPALVLKTSGADFSILDREEILSKINDIRDSIGVGCPNVYLIHGDLSHSEMNSLYNHPKVKAHISFTKGEGFGRPLLEASMSETPILASGWSGHLDFLNTTDSILLGGELRPIEPGAVWPGILIPESSWFNVDTTFASKAMRLVFKHPERFEDGAKRLAKLNSAKFNSDAIKSQLESLIKKYVPSHILTPPKLVPLVLPNLPQYEGPKVGLPTLRKLGG